MTSCSRCNETVYEVSNPVVPDRIRELAITQGDDADHCSHPNPLAAGLADPDKLSRHGHDITGQPKMCRESSGSAQHGKCLTGEMPVSAGSVSLGRASARRRLGSCNPGCYLSRFSAPARRWGIRACLPIDLPLGLRAWGSSFPHTERPSRASSQTTARPGKLGHVQLYPGARCSGGFLGEMMYEINKGIPVPVSARKRSGRKSKYPFSTMEVGDSFFVPLDGWTAEKAKRSIQAASRNFTKKMKWSFQYYDLGDKLGVWRMPDRGASAKPRVRAAGKKAVVHMEGRA